MAVKTITVPDFSYNGIDVPSLDITNPFVANLRDVTSPVPGPGTIPAYELAADSIPLVWYVALYSVGRDMNIKLEDPEQLPDTVKKAGKMVYNHAQERQCMGLYHRDAVLREPNVKRIRGEKKPKDGVAARYFADIAGFEYTGDDWKIIPAPETKEVSLWLPPGAGMPDEVGDFVAPTPEGIYHNLTGTPLRTVRGRERAIREWTKAGLTEEQAEKEVSRFFRGCEHSTVNAVLSWSDQIYGPLSISLNMQPDELIGGYGSFAARRKEARPRAQSSEGQKALVSTV